LLERASLELWERLEEDVFFFMYYLKQNRPDILKMPINSRKWLIHRLILEKEKENAAQQAARKKNSKGK
jgi:hypothetical protein